MKRTTDVEVDAYRRREVRSRLAKLLQLARAFVPNALVACLLITVEARAEGKSYNGIGNGDDLPTAIAVDSRGNVYVTGTSKGNNTGNDYATVKYDNNGTVLWEARYEGPGDDYAVAIAVDNNGNVYVTGSSWGGQINGYDYVTIKYSPDPRDPLNERQYVLGWGGVKRYNGTGSGDDMAKGLDLDVYGNVHVTGTSWGYIPSLNFYGNEMATIKYASGNGAELWPRPARIYGEAAAIAVSGGGQVYVTGRSQREGSGWDWLTVKYTAAGELDVFQYLDGGHNLNDEPRAIKLQGTNVWVTGKSRSPLGGINGMTAQYSVWNLNLLGVDAWNGQVGEDEVTAMAIDRGGQVYLAGYYTEGAFSKDLFARNNATLWVYDASFRRVPGLADYATAIAIDNNNRVYVTGVTTSPTGQGFDYITLKLNAGPGFEWKKPFATAGDELASAIAVDANGNVFVTGSSPVPGQGRNYVTVSYSSMGAARWQ